MLSLKTQRRKLQSYAAQLSASSARDALAARQLVAGGLRERALLALRSRRRTEASLAQTQGWLARVDDALSQLDSAQRTQLLVSALQSGAEVLKRLSEACKVEEVEAMLGAGREAGEAAMRVAQALGEGGEEAAQAQRELEEMEAAWAAEQAAELPAVPREAPLVAQAAREETGAAATKEERTEEALMLAA